MKKYNILPLLMLSLSSSFFVIYPGIGWENIPMPDFLKNIDTSKIDNTTVAVLGVGGTLALYGLYNLFISTRLPEQVLKNQINSLLGEQAVGVYSGKTIMYSSEVESEMKKLSPLTRRNSTVTISGYYVIDKGSLLFDNISIKNPGDNPGQLYVQINSYNNNDSLSRGERSGTQIITM